MPMDFKDEDKQQQLHQITPIAPSDSAIAKQDSAKPVATRKSGKHQKNKPAQSAISTQAQKVDQRVNEIGQTIGAIDLYLNHQAEDLTDQLVDVLVGAPDRLFEMIEKKVGAIEIDPSQFDKFSSDIGEMLEGFRNARATRSQA